MDDETTAPPRQRPDSAFLMSPSVRELTSSLIALQQQMKPVPKRAVNPHFNSLYASLPDIMEELLPLLGECDLALMQFPTDAGPRRAGLTTIVLHRSGEYLGITAACGLGKDDAQAYAGGITYLRRYALAALGVVTDTDDDGNGASAPIGQRAGSVSANGARPASAKPAPAPAPAARSTGRPAAPSRRQTDDDDL